jgi:hypothetical protein
MLSGRGFLRFCVYWQDKINFIKFTSIHRENAKTKPNIFGERGNIYEGKSISLHSLKRDCQQDNLQNKIRPRITQMKRIFTDKFKLILQ